MFNFLHLTALKSNGLNPEDIGYVISTHGHSDHCGNNNLFLKAKHILGQSVSFKTEYILHDFKDGMCKQITILHYLMFTNKLYIMSKSLCKKIDHEDRIIYNIIC